MLSATSPFADPNASVLSKDGTIAYGTVAFDVPPDTLDDTYLTQLDNAVQPARAAGITVEYGGAAGKIASATDDRTSETDGRGGRPGGAGRGRLKFSAPACRIRAVRVDVSIEGQLLQERDREVRHVLPLPDLPVRRPP